MKLAIMQPYLFPYIGYFQLINYCDKFIIFDDVNYIKKGWINKNRISLNGHEFKFSVPLRNVSQNQKIYELKVAHNFNQWLSNFYKTLEYEYKKCPHFENGMEIITKTFSGDSDSFLTILRTSLIEVCKYLSINICTIKLSSRIKSHSLKGEERIIDLCKKECAQMYVNLPGGQGYYSYENFHQNNILLKFIKPIFIPFKKNNSIEGLSILDYIMNLNPDEIRIHLNSFELISNDR